MNHVMLYLPITLLAIILEKILLNTKVKRYLMGFASVKLSILLSVLIYYTTLCACLDYLLTSYDICYDFGTKAFYVYSLTLMIALIIMILDMILDNVQSFYQRCAPMKLLAPLLTFTLFLLDRGHAAYIPNYCFMYIAYKCRYSHIAFTNVSTIFSVISALYCAVLTPPYYQWITVILSRDIMFRLAEINRKLHHNEIKSSDSIVNAIIIGVPLMISTMILEASMQSKLSYYVCFVMCLAYLLITHPTVVQQTYFSFQDTPLQRHLMHIFFITSILTISGLLLYLDPYAAVEPTIILTIVVIYILNQIIKSGRIYLL